eukprot:15425234-Alexandrium_andersonii.AAC.1
MPTFSGRMPGEWVLRASAVFGPLLIQRHATLIDHVGVATDCCYRLLAKTPRIRRDNSMILPQA